MRGVGKNSIFTKVDRNLLLFLIAASFLRIFSLTKYGIWFDEAVSIIYAQFPFSQYLQFMPYNTNPFLFHRLLRLWLFFSENDFYLRMFSVCAGVCSVYVFYRVCRQLHEFGLKKKTIIISALLFVVSPLHIYYSRELTQYALLSCFSLCSTLFLLKAVKKDRGKSWFLYCLFALGAMYINSFAVFFIGAQLLWCLGLKSVRKSPRKYLVSTAAIAVSSVPFFMIVSLQTYNALHSKIIDWAGGFSGWLMIGGLFNAFNIGYTLDIYDYMLAFLVFGALFTLGVISLRKNKVLLSFLIMLAFFPLSLGFLSSQIVRVFLYRCFLFSLPFYLVIVARGINEGFSSSLAVRRFTLVCVSAVAVLTFFSLKNYYANRYPLPEAFFRMGVHPGKDYGGAARFVAENFAEGDIVGHSSMCTFASFLHYHKKLKEHNFPTVQNALLYLFPQEGSYYHVVEWFLKTAGKEAQDSVGGNIKLDVETISSAYKRVWLIFSDWEPFPYLFDRTCLKIKDWMFDNFSLIASRETSGISIYLFDVK